MSAILRKILFLAKNLFWDRKFFNYTWIGVFVSFLNIFLIWFLIDIIGLSTIFATSLVIFGTFILRYVLFLFFGLLKSD